MCTITQRCSTQFVSSDWINWEILQATPKNLQFADKTQAGNRLKNRLRWYKSLKIIVTRSVVCFIQHLLKCFVCSRQYLDSIMTEWHLLVCTRWFFNVTVPTASQMIRELINVILTNSSDWWRSWNHLSKSVVSIIPGKSESDFREVECRNVQACAARVLLRSDKS